MMPIDRHAARERRRRPIRFSASGRLAAIILVSALAIPLPAAAQFGDLMRSVAPMIPAQRPATTTSPPANSPRSSASGESGAMGLQAPTALPPLRRLGTDAVAVVEAASPKAPVREMDYVFAKQTITLGPTGRITLSYLSGCLTETIQGGVVTVAVGGSKVAGGKRQESNTPGCRAARPVMLASASEAGATVNRITPFSAVSWEERALKSAQPVFKWEKTLGVASLRVKNMDQPGEPVVWQSPVGDQDWIAYPPKTAALAPGAPYRVEALAGGGGVVATALFSIDPWLDVADNLASRVVPLTAP